MSDDNSEFEKHALSRVKLLRKTARPKSSINDLMVQAYWLGIEDANKAMREESKKALILGVDGKRIN